MIELNNTINWKPKSTGVGRFGNWLENLVDWNLSRSRFWGGVGLPIWITEDRKEQKCIGSVAQLKEEIERAVEAGFMTNNPLAEYISDDNSEENYSKFDLHRPYIDEIILVSDKGEKMYRELDLIDVWFDSGAMPYAQFHYPFEKVITLPTISLPILLLKALTKRAAGFFYAACHSNNGFRLRSFQNLCFQWLGSR